MTNGDLRCRRFIGLGRKSSGQGRKKLSIAELRREAEARREQIAFVKRIDAFSSRRTSERIAFEASKTKKSRSRRPSAPLRNSAIECCSLRRYEPGRNADVISEISTGFFPASSIVSRCEKPIRAIILFECFITGPFKPAGDPEKPTKKMGGGRDSGNEADRDASPHLHPFIPTIPIKIASRQTQEAGIS